MKVLIVDDNEQARRMIKHYLREFSDEFRECEDGADALETYAEFLPDWVLMDWEMKRFNGLAATQNIISRFPDAKIIIVTNYDETDLRDEARKAGACGYMLKDNLIDLSLFFQKKRFLEI